MPAKRDATRQKIIDASIRLFSQKGYTAVTMKDICNGCSLSRGGLYRYFSSTKEIFLAMLDRDIDEDRNAVKQAMHNRVPARIIFEHYLSHEKDAIFSDEVGLHFAIHEFAFAEPDQNAYFDHRASLAVDLLAELFRYGQETGEFRKFHAMDMAAHMICFFDGLKTSASVLATTAEMTDRQLQLIREMVI